MSDSARDRSRSRERRHHRHHRHRSRSPDRHRKESSNKPPSPIRTISPRKNTNEPPLKKKKSGWDQLQPPKDPKLDPSIAALAAANSQSASFMKEARKVFIGNLPDEVTEAELRKFFSKGTITNCQINKDKNLAFVEFKTVEESEAALSLNGGTMKGKKVVLRRPTDFNPSQANVFLSRFGVVATQVQNGPNKIFMGGVPFTLSEDDVKELISSYGALKAFHLVKEKDASGQSKGYCFFEYLDSTITEAAIKGLNGIRIGDRALVCRRAEAKQAREPVKQTASGIALGANPFLSVGQVNIDVKQSLKTLDPTRILCLTQMVSEEELADDEEYNDIKDDITEESKKYGNVITIVIPRPEKDKKVPGVGKVFIEFESISQCTTARNALEGRRFGDRTVLAQYYSENAFKKREFN